MTDAIILAAGNSKRFGSTNKLFTQLYSKPLISHVVNEICKSKVKNIFVITGKDHDQICDVLNNYRVNVVKNQNHILGINSSISLGIENLDPVSNSVMICLGDMPLLLSKDYNKLLNFNNNFGGKNKITVPFNSNQNGNPAIFGSRFYKRLLCLKGDEGGKKIIDENNNHLVKFFTDFKGFYYDIDVKSDILELSLK